MCMNVVNKYVVYKLVVVEFNLTECTNLIGNLNFKNFSHFRMNIHGLNKHKNNCLPVKINLTTYAYLDNKLLSEFSTND